MNKAVCILALLAVAFVASEASYCHTSAYKVPVTDAVNNKMKMFKNCLAAGKIAAMPVITSTTTKDGCALLVQKVSSSAAWDAYSKCEKSQVPGVEANKLLYAPLTAASGPCSQFKKGVTC